MISMMGETPSRVLADRVHQGQSIFVLNRIFQDLPTPDQINRGFLTELKVLTPYFAQKTRFLR